MKILKRISIFVFTVVLLFSLFLLYITMTDFKPEEIVELTINNNVVKTIQGEDTLTMTTFNIGYGGLDENENFFADGGKNSRASSLVKVQSNLSGIVNIIDDINPDFLLLQEVDTNSSRSFNEDQIVYLNRKYPNYSYTYGINYDVPWVPVPILRPMGKVESGIATFSKYHNKKAYRYQLPGFEEWPVQLFELDRCFTENTFSIDNDKELIVINIHLSAFDKGGLIRQVQLKYLKNYLDEKNKDGNYIIVGGDWNHNLPGSHPYDFKSKEPWPFWLKNLPEDFEVEGYNWAIDPTVPTVRTLGQEYEKGFNFLATIDGFLVSENIEVLEVFTIHNEFQNSDHNPVTMKFRLN